VTILKSAGALLREARLRSGLSQAELGRRAGVAQSVISAYEAGRRQPSLPVLLALIAGTGHALDVELRPTQTERRPLSGPVGRRVQRHRNRLRRIAADHDVRDVRVFGSVARGEDSPDSDIDLLIDVPEAMGLFALGRLRRDLEDILGVTVDLVPAQGLKPAVRAAIEADLLAL
jgi:uncharacterized protein